MLVLVLLLCGITLRATLGGEREIALSTSALEAGDAAGAVAHARAAALWYVPGAPHVRVAYARLKAIGEEAEKRRNWQVALAAYRSISNASHATRWVLTPHRVEAQAAEEAVARVEAKLKELSPPNVDASERETPPTKATSDDLAYLRYVLAGSFGGAILGLLLLLRRGLDDTGRIAWKRAAPGLAITLLGTLAYLAALLLA
jgi:hypothetical protein